MWTELDQETPLVGLGHPPGGFTYGQQASVLLSELPFVELTNLRGEPGSPDFLTAVRDGIGTELPTTPNTVATGAGCCAMWLAPNEWLLRSTGAQPTDLARRLDAALGKQFFAATDQSSGYSVIRLSGPHARAVLAKGSPLDLHPRAFGVGQCAQTHYFKTSVLLRPLDLAGQEVWEVIVRRSFADYAVRIMLDAMAEYLGPGAAAGSSSP